MNKRPLPKKEITCKVNDRIIHIYYASNDKRQDVRSVAGDFGSLYTGDDCDTLITNPCFDDQEVANYLEGL